MKFILDSRILNVSSKKFLLELANTEDLLNLNSEKNEKSTKERKNISTIDIKYVYGQLEIYGDFKKDCVFNLVRAKQTASKNKRKDFKGYSRNRDL